MVHSLRFTLFGLKGQEVCKSLLLLKVDLVHVGIITNIDHYLHKSNWILITCRPLCTWRHGVHAVGHTVGQLEPLSMEKMYRGCLCRSFARNAGISFSYSCSILDCSQCASRYHFVGWCPGTTIEQEHFLALASTILHRPLYSNMAANYRVLRIFLVRAMGLYMIVLSLDAPCYLP